MNEKELADLLKYSSPKEIYVVTYQNRLIVLVCPFKVMVKYNLDVLMAKEVVEVEEVKITIDLVNVYVISGKGYYYYHFEILIK